jgi:hypothetical protein
MHTKYAAGDHAVEKEKTGNHESVVQPKFCLAFQAYNQSQAYSHSTQKGQDNTELNHI